MENECFVTHKRHCVSFALPSSIFSPTSYQHYSCLSWFSTCWPFPLEFPPSSSQIYIYRLLHCLQIKSKNSPFLWCTYLWPLAISIHALLIWHNHVNFCILKLYYVMLCVSDVFCGWIATVWDWPSRLQYGCSKPEVITLCT